MRAPLDGLPFVCAGAGPVIDAASALLDALGADVVRVETVHGPEHARRIAGVEPVGALDASGVLATAAPPFAVVQLAPVDPATAWAASGALALTGPAAGPPASVDPVVPARLLAAGAVVQLLAACRESALELDPLALLGERAAIAGFGRRGPTSVGGHCHLVRVADGWVAVNLARPDDIAFLPALLDGEVAPDAPWPDIAAAFAGRTRRDLDERAALLGFPLGAVPDADGAAPAVPTPYAFGDTPESRRPRLRPTVAVGVHSAPARPLVVDLSSLWAGPLAASILGLAGARVVKVESRSRPDGARRGPAAFFDLLHAGKESLALDLADPADRALLDRLVRAADVVIDASRPRAMQGLGIDPAAVVAGGATTWISITGHGRRDPASSRAAFGDDAAAAAGLVCGDPPVFVADAVADPITALHAAAAALAALVGRRGQVIDVALQRCAAFVVAGVDRRVAHSWPGPVGEPHARAPRGRAPRLGEHDRELRTEFGAGPIVRP